MPLPARPGNESAAVGVEPESNDLLAAKTGDAKARARLLDAYTPLIAGTARMYRGSPAVDRKELMQEGAVGVLRALERYDPALGTPFWAYASWWVRQAMQHLVAELTRPVVLSDRALRQIARIKGAHHLYLQDHGRAPTTDELAHVTGLRRRQIEHLLAVERRPRCLDEPVGLDESSRSTLVEVLADPRAEEAYDAVPARLICEQLPELLDRLNDRERLVVRGHFGLDGRERTLRELGDGLGVSAERARQIERGALDKLRDVITTAAVAG